MKWRMNSVPLGTINNNLELELTVAELCIPSACPAFPASGSWYDSCSRHCAELTNQKGDSYVFSKKCSEERLGLFDRDCAYRGRLRCTAVQCAQATASNDVNEVLPPGTVLNVGQGTYIVPALPASSGDTGYALTGRGTPGESAPFDGRWISGTNGWVYIPPAP